MKTELRWAKEAAADLEHITDYLFQNTPERAAELVRGIYDAPAALLTFPYRGRAGRGQIEPVNHPLPPPYQGGESRGEGVLEKG